jgi:hypothetical protein
LIINGLFSVTSNHVKDIYTSGDHPHQFGREVHFGDLLCSSYQRMISVAIVGTEKAPETVDICLELLQVVIG